MKHEFYDVKAKAKVSETVTEFKTYGDASRTRYAFKAVTKDGHKLTAFVSKAVWDAAQKKK